MRYEMDWSASGKKPEILASRVETNIALTPDTIPTEVVGLRPLGVKWEAELTPRETGEYYLGLEGDGGFNLSVDGNVASTSYDTNGIETKLTKVHLEAGKAVKLEANYGATALHQLAMRLVWKKVDLTPQPEAIAAAKDADVVVAVVGITSELEGEEMKVSEPGFKGGDRISIDLPKPEEDLLRGSWPRRTSLLSWSSPMAAPWPSTGPKPTPTRSSMPSIPAKRVAQPLPKRSLARTIPPAACPSHSIRT